MKLSAITSFLDQLYPLEYAESWDYPGLIFGDPDAEVDRIILAVDPVMSVVELLEEQQRNAVEDTDASGLIITHHPLFFRPTSLVGGNTFRGKFLNRLANCGYGLYNAHTNADVAVYGVSYALAELLELENVRPLVPVGNQLANRGAAEGHGRVGELPNRCTLRQLAQNVSEMLPLPNLQVCGDIEREIRTVAVLGGAGDSFFDAVESSGADVYITSDLRHHPVLDAKFERSFALINTLHYASEFPWLKVLKAQLEQRFETDLSVQIFEQPTDPWNLRIG
jgi:dinuclear metal center YbgI/SA1388 family protein